MRKNAPETAQILPEEPDASGETETTEPREYLDDGKVVVSIRKGIEKINLMNELRNELARLEGILQYKKSYLNSGQLTDHPSHDKRVKSTRHEVEALEKEIAEIEDELAELEAEKKT